MTTLVDQVLAIGAALDDGGIDWALGGALALAYATEEPRGTRDIDVNVFVPSASVAHVFAALPTEIAHSSDDEQSVVDSDQVRLWWDDTPVDLFFAASDFHMQVAGRTRRVPFAGSHVNVLGAEDLAVFKALFDRSRDWVDIDEMAAAGALDRTVAAERLASLLDRPDPRIDRLAGTGR
jgi:predicted nucleotidyltransferase